MPVTTLDPKTALVIIDLQRGVAAMAAGPVLDGVVAKAAALTKAFRAKGLPVVLVNVAGVAPGRTDAPRFAGPFPEGFDELLPELDAQPSDHKVTKHSWGAFPNTDLADYLKAQGVTQIVLAGVATSIGVESTAREAYALGLNITLAVDAMTDRVPEAHDNSVNIIFPRLGEVGTAQDVIDALQAR